MKQFKYAPESIPDLTLEQWRTLDKPLTERQKEVWKRADEVYKAIKNNSEKNQMKEHICVNCGVKYPCPEPINHFTGKPCDLPEKFGNCSEKCKLEWIVKNSPKIVILGDTPFSIACYLEEYSDKFNSQPEETEK
jgi:hypothetical protein